MYRLTDEQIEYILNDIRQNGVEIEDLQMNLLDHICCIIERELVEGDDFEVFYQQMIQRFYKNELKEIEEETINLLTFKNYYAMKKLMIASGAYTVAAFIVGSFFKIMQWPGAIVFLFSAIVVFSLAFLPLVLFLKTKEASTLRDKVITALSALVGILYCLSSLFLLQHWQGARLLWLSTLSISFFVLIPLYFFNGIRKPETKLNTIVTTIILMGVLGIQFSMTALHKTKKIHPTVYVQNAKGK